MPLIKVLVLEDDLNLTAAIKSTLAKDYEILPSATFDEGMKILNEQNVTIAVVDDVLPRKSGISFIQEAKVKFPSLIFVMMTAQPTIATTVQCVNLGVKRFLEKPFSLSILRKVLDELSPPPMIFLDEQTVLRADFGRIEQRGNDIGLTPIEFKIIAKIASGRGNFVCRETLNNHIWGNNTVSSNALDTHLSSARKKLGATAGCIKMTRGKGYRWESSGHD